MTTEEPDLTGLVLDGRYALVRRLGVGGMGSVYEARHVRIARSVAVKVLNREFAYKESFRRRFLREAQAASLIRHRHVVAIHDFGDSDDVAYLVMELLEGRDLHALVHERTRLPWAEARGILVQMASALGAAHDCGVIHRDIKPANVFVADDPHDGRVVKVLDFGIARASTIKAAEPGDQGATGSSRVFGTPAYMAPEIAFGEPADARSDIYSLGVVAYRVLTGQLPFDGEVPYLVISRHANEPPAPLRSLEPAIPPGVEQIVLKALAKRPSERFQSMASLGRALAAIDEAGHGEVPAELLGETESSAAAGREVGDGGAAPGREHGTGGSGREAQADAPRTDVLASAGRAQRGARRKVGAARELDARDDDDEELRSAPPSEPSDVGTPVTDLGTQRLPSRRRVTGVSDVEDLRRAGAGERASGESMRRSSGELETDTSALRSASGPISMTAAARPWSGALRVLGLFGLVAVAAAVGAIVARTQQEPAARVPGPAPGITAARDAEAREGKDEEREHALVEGPTSDRSSAGGAPPGEAGSTALQPATNNTGPTTPSTQGATAPADGTTSTTTSAKEPAPAQRPASRRPTDASVKKKLVRELQRACGAAAAGYHVTIEGIITAEGEVTGVRVLDAPGDARGCIEGRVEAQRFPPGELRTLDLSLTL